MRKNFVGFLELQELELRTRLCMALRTDNVAVCYSIRRHFLIAYIIQGDLRGGECF